MLLLMTAMLTYYFIGDHDKENAAPPPPSEMVVSPSPDAVTPEPEATATVTPEVTASAEPTPDPSTEASPVQENIAEATPSPEASRAPETATGSGDDGDGGDGGQNTVDAVSGLPENAGDTVTLNFAGDVIFAGKVGELLQKKGYDYSYSALNGMFKKDDLTVVNLETPITTGGVSAENKQFVFKGAPEALDALKSAGVDAVNLANNHTLDQGEQGLLDTLSNLSKRGIPYVGAGADSKEAYTTQYFERQESG